MCNYVHQESGVDVMPKGRWNHNNKSNDRNNNKSNSNNWTKQGIQSMKFFIESFTMHGVAPFVRSLLVFVVHGSGNMGDTTASHRASTSVMVGLW